MGRTEGVTCGMKQARGARGARSGRKRDAVERPKTEAEPTSTSDARPAFVLQLEYGRFAVAVWVRDEAGTPIYEIRHRGIRVARLAAILAVEEGGSKTGR